MKRIWKIAKHIIFLCLLTGVLCACQREQGTGQNATPAEVTGTGMSTPEATVTTLPEESKTPSVTETPLTTPHRSRRENGFLSGAERGVVTEMQIGNEDGLADEDVSPDCYAAIKEESLDGFEYFPNLTEVNISWMSARW